LSYIVSSFHDWSTVSAMIFSLLLDGQLLIIVEMPCWLTGRHKGATFAACNVKPIYSIVPLCLMPKLHVRVRILDQFQRVVAVSARYQHLLNDCEADDYDGCIFFPYAAAYFTAYFSSSWSFDTVGFQSGKLTVYPKVLFFYGSVWALSSCRDEAQLNRNGKC